MKYKIILAFSFWTLLFAVSCNRDDISFESPSQALRFSTDTVFCDTVYNQVRSETYAVKVFNDEDKDILIPNISLRDGAGSLYKINVDGKSGFSFDNVALRKKDSLYIFVEIAPTASVPEAIAEDQVLFKLPTGEQKVTLFSVVQDAEFFVETPGNPNVLNGNVNWNNTKAKIIYGDLTISSGSTLNIGAGTKVYFFKNSGMKISTGASLNINGDLGSEVILRGDRNDPKYDTLPKNWNSIDFAIGSTLNMNYARLFGGTNGLQMNQTNATINNTIIHTFQESGIFAINSTIVAKNLVMNNCGNADVTIQKGGNYDFTHCTLANYWDNLGTGNVLFASNSFINENGQTENGALNLNIKNSILWNNKSNAVVLKPTVGQVFTYIVQNALLKYETSAAGFNFTGNPQIVSSIINTDPYFTEFNIPAMNLKPAFDSPAKNKGNPSFAASIPLDILKLSRASSNPPPTLGAYQ
ncbi:hypothetical protein [Frigoriflavimonas asaccharolytica]|uniref:Parallel beta helix pectate lyase-like protein n=1 Tax=Frigoriflavimonas asaccharolytica TaxID=2735899 RepID=A0A8J8K6C8_9FLAO|nr:hypothetical protein [Frigoriflavimonas asaccharolytica]NRS93600.1 hypothetical protein [Frigoriflavimonas asaccharolytica]